MTKFYDENYGQSVLANIPDNIRFEDSYVLGLTVEPYIVSLSMDFALRPEHPLFINPNAGEWACFRRGRIVIAEFNGLNWKTAGIRLPGADATGEVDYGELDSFTSSGSGFLLEGSWGVIEIAGGSLKISFNELESSIQRVAAAARIIYTAGQRHHWFGSGVPKDYEGLDPIGREEFDSIIAAALEAADNSNTGSLLGSTRPQAQK